MSGGHMNFQFRWTISDQEAEVTLPAPPASYYPTAWIKVDPGVKELEHTLKVKFSESGEKTITVQARARVISDLGIWVAHGATPWAPVTALSRTVDVVEVTIISEEGQEIKQENPGSIQLTATVDPAEGRTIEWELSGPGASIMDTPSPE